MALFATLETRRSCHRWAATMRRGINLKAVGALLALTFVTTNGTAVAQENRTPATIERKTSLAPDAVTIVYSAAGAGETALVFIHGGLADRTFFDAQLKAFADSYRVIALDLAGHGESGANRPRWGIPEFAADVKAVVEAEKLKRVILFGNSLGGPTAIEAALLLPGRVIGVVGIDTFQRLDYSMTNEAARQGAEAFRTDYSGTLNSMVRMFFHADADPALIAEAERRMQKSPPESAYEMFLSLAGYNPADSARNLAVPLRAINGDRFPTDVASIRKIKPDFNVVVMKHTGHYPMLERPDELNRHVLGMVQELTRGAVALGGAASGTAQPDPEVYPFRQIDEQTLNAYVFSPSGRRPESRANGVLLFHGGGWAAGTPEWTFETARRFADSGLVAIAVQYRLSEGDITPIEALDDVCAAFAWARERAPELGLTERLAGYGVSAGGHLVTATVTVGCPGASGDDPVGPAALLLWSPALDVSGDGWFRKKLQGRATAATYSPVEHVRASTPPTSIVHGKKDTLTPLSGVQVYCDRLIALGGMCELHVYDGVGHLLTRNLANQESDFDPDPEARADGIAQHLRFLKELQFIPRESGPAGV